MIVEYSHLDPVTGMATVRVPWRLQSEPMKIVQSAVLTEVATDVGLLIDASGSENECMSLTGTEEQFRRASERMPSTEVDLARLLARMWGAERARRARFSVRRLLLSDAFPDLDDVAMQIRQGGHSDKAPTGGDAGGTGSPRLRAETGRVANRTATTRDGAGGPLREVPLNGHVDLDRGLIAFDFTLKPDIDTSWFVRWDSEGLSTVRVSETVVRLTGTRRQFDGLTYIGDIARDLYETAISEKYSTDPDVVTRQWAENVAPLGTPIDVAIEQVWHTGGTMCRGALRFNDSFRPLAFQLARKFTGPNEQLLAAFEVSQGSSASTKKKRMAVVVFTHGFAVKASGRTFRTEPTVEFVDRPRFAGDTNPPQSVEVVLGDVRLTGDVEKGHVLPYILRLQRQLQEQQQNRSARSEADRPLPRLIRSARDAELVAAEWMAFMGFTHVQPTAVGADGGVDVVSDEAVAQVKAEMKPVGRPAVQQHHGVATALGKQALFFSLAGYSEQARTFAHDQGIALYSFDLQGDPEPVNATARALWMK